MANQCHSSACSYLQSLKRIHILQNFQRATHCFPNHSTLEMPLHWEEGGLRIGRNVPEASETSVKQPLDKAPFHDSSHPDRDSEISHSNFNHLLYYCYLVGGTDMVLWEEKVTFLCGVPHKPLVVFSTAANVLSAYCVPGTVVGVFQVFRAKQSPWERLLSSNPSQWMA